MAVIHELSPHLADLIAAGEVVERPSSVAKELVENAIDAGSTRITVEIENGGITYLRIADNGCGMSAEDAPVAFRRHATSKLRTEEDLNAIGTLGFRGEALAAISSVTRIDLFTRQAGSIAGLHLHLEAGEIQTQEEAGCPEGTTIVVRDLFFNTPARMKFLKKDFTEAGYILGVVQHAALSHPEIAFTLIRDGKQVFSSDGKGKLIAPVFGVFGKEMTANMIEVPMTERNSMTVHGYIVKPHAGRANRSMQHFFVNGRYVKSRLMQAAMEEAYRNAIITGKYPSGALFLDLPLSAVDVNVHPAKTEVKFSQEKPIFEVVYIACKNALAANDNMPHLEHKEKEAPAKPREDNLTHEQQRFVIPKPVDPKPFVTPSVKPTPIAPVKNDEEAPDLEDFLVSIPPKAERPRSASSYLSAPRILQEEPQEPVRTRMVQPVEPVTESTPAVHTPAPEPEDEPMVVVPSVSAPEVKGKPQILQPLDTGVRVIGECFQTYIIAEDKDGLILIDKHAAHERILYNRLKRGKPEQFMQNLLLPISVLLSQEEYSAALEHLDVLLECGFEIEDFGGRSLLVRSAPMWLENAQIEETVAEICGYLAQGKQDVSPERLDWLYHNISCRAAIKGGDRSTPEELTEILKLMQEDGTVFHCPHGRPVAVFLTKKEIE
mgnify:CR=1 FL=1